MESNDLKALSELYLQTVYEDKKYGYDKDGNSLNPVDIEKKKRKDDDLFGAPNSKKKKVKEDRDEPLRDQDDQQIANVTFDGGGPDGGATIKGSGDPREIPTFVALIKNKLRARGILVSHKEPEGKMVEGYDNTKAPDYDKKKKALAKKHGGADKVKGHPQYESTVQSAVDSLNAIAKKEGKVIEGYQRDPEKGEEEARKADTRSAKQKRMADPKKGINSPAFRKFMADRGM